MPAAAAVSVVDEVSYLHRGFGINEQVVAYDILTVNKRYNPVQPDGIGVHDTAPTYAYRPGAIVAEMIRASAALTPALRYSQLLADRLFVAELLSTAAGVLVSQGIGVNQAQTVVRALVMMEHLGLLPATLPALRYTQVVAQAVGMHDALTRFLGASLSDGIGITDALTRLYRPQPVLADGIGASATLSTKLILRVTAAEGIGMTAAQALSAIYNGVIADGIEISAGYVSPGGNFTAWAMNTRTAAVTEYSNFEFNSYAQLGTKYVAARADGLYELTGDTDAGASIIADLKSGFAQWSSTHLGRIKAAYIATRGGGNYVLKITTGEGDEVVYSVATQGMRSAKIHMGKGLRTRYFAFELISVGQDFDLDTLEFVPLVVQRRV